jgi:hypothetical protein
MKHDLISLKEMLKAGVSGGNGNAVITKTQCGTKGGNMDDQILKAKQQEMAGDRRKVKPEIPFLARDAVFHR